MRDPFSFIIGYKRLSFDLAYAADILNICHEHRFVYRRQTSDGESMSLELSLFVATQLLRSCEKKEIPVREVREGGLPCLLGKYRRRYGFFAGCILFTLIIFLSSSLLWDIEIEGEERISEAEVLCELRECGLTVGMPLSKIKADTIQNRVLMHSDNISWIAVNLIGTVAHVEIREHMSAEEIYEPQAANLIATCDGTIEYLEEVRGNPVVTTGDLVREGELLVSGIYDSDSVGFHFLAAKGRVMARTEEHYRIEIPLKYQLKVYTGRSFCEKYLIFFSQEIKIYSNSRNLPPKCDTIDTVEYLDILSGGELPVGIRTIKHLEYEYTDAERSPKEAIDKAHLALRDALDAADNEALLKKSFECELTDECYILNCTVEVIKNIAKQVEIEINQN